MPEKDARKSAKAVESKIQQLESSARDEKLVKFIAQRVQTGKDQCQPQGLGRVGLLVSQSPDEKEGEQPKGRHVRERADDFGEADVPNMGEVNPSVNLFRQQAVGIGA